MKTLLIYPVFALILFNFLILMYSFTQRLKAIKAKKVNYRYFIEYKGDELPKNLHLLSRSFDNQFQVPMLFFITVILLIILKLDNSYFVLLSAWGFVISRLVHFYFHAIKQVLIGRYRTYAVGWLFIFMLWGPILIHNF